MITHLFPVENIKDLPNRGWLIYTPILAIIHIISVKNFKEIGFIFVSWIILYIGQIIVLSIILFPTLKFLGILPPQLLNAVF